MPRMAHDAEPRWALRIGCLAIPLAIVALVGAVRYPPVPQHRRVVASVGGAIYDLEVAETVSQQQRGLQGSPAPGSAGGMLFVFDPPQP